MNSLPRSTLDERFDFASLVDEVSHLLPSQAPIRRFVHHNTLHHFEDLDFHRGVEIGAALLHREPYPAESFFIEQLKAGRIHAADLEAVLDQECTGGESLALPFVPWTRRDFQHFRLGHLFHIPQSNKVRYLLEEGDLLCSIAPQVPGETRELLRQRGVGRESLSSLWQILLRQSPSINSPTLSPKQNLETHIHPFLIRFCGAYLDQGVSYWPMPERHGLYRSFLRLYSGNLGITLPWQKGLRDRLRRQLDGSWTSSMALEEAFTRLGIGSEDSFGALRDRALALRGWAGMVSALEKRPDLAPVECPPVSLQDFLAIYFQLEAHLAEQSPVPRRASRKAMKPNYSLTFESFVLAQCAGFDETVLSDDQKAYAWLREVAHFHELKRRRLLLSAYECHYRNEVLDALKEHHAMGESKSCLNPRFQAVFCIDDREESLRRHLEESCANLETLGYAGFFGVCMAYQGLGDPHALPLCPPTQSPKHLLREVGLGGGGAFSQTLGAFRQVLRASRNSVLRGGVLAAIPGFLAGIPLLGQTLFPSLFHRLANTLEKTLSPPTLTRLKLERCLEEGPNEQGLFEGFTVEEMVEIVKSGLQTMGVSRFAPLFLLVGHGSSSLNNPHEAAHDCGATGGGRGGPNARAFAMMANHPRVRLNLKELGMNIPDSTWFVGGYHNTCDDSMVYYDLDLMPAALRQEMDELQALFLKACILDAHERCRRFENVSLTSSPHAAYRHVQARAVTLSQPRPEYGHCTNSLCLIGRRRRSRGLFLDRRAFLVSYDCSKDPDGTILGALLEAVGPVGAGINLEYYFSSIDPSGYGCGTKLPHNVSGLLGVMDGHSSDLRTGLPWQMVEIHEPMRLLNIVEVEPEVLLAVLNQRPGLMGLVDRGWINLVCQSPSGGIFWLYEGGRFVEYHPCSKGIPTLEKSRQYYQGHREHLPIARMRAGL